MDYTKNRKWLLICISVLGAVTLIITIFLLIVRLDRPLFFKNYANYFLINDHKNSCLQQEFTIQYLSDADDSRTVTGIEFPDIKNDQIYFYATESANSLNVDFLFSGMNNTGSSTAQKFGMYLLHTVRIIIQCKFEAEKQNPNIVLQNALIRFSDGTVQETNLGEIQIYFEAPEQALISQISSMGSSDGTSEETLQSNDTLTVINLQWSPFLKADGLFKVSINGIDSSSDKINGMIIQRGERFILRAEFPESNRLSEKFNTYKLSTILTVIDSEGIQKELNLTPIYHTPYPSGVWDILQYVWLRRSE